MDFNVDGPAPWWETEAYHNDLENKAKLYRQLRGSNKSKHPLLKNMLIKLGNSLIHLGKTL